MPISKRTNMGDGELWNAFVGVVESTGGTTQVRTSYLPSEILWGHRLTPLMTYQKENGQYRIDYSQFHSVEPVSMPECSAKCLAAERQRGQSDNDDDDEHGQAYFTSPAVRLSSTGNNRLSIIRRMRTSLQRRHGRGRNSQYELTSAAKNDDDARPAADAGGNDVVDAERSVRSGTEADINGTSLAKEPSQRSNNRSISFA